MRSRQIPSTRKAVDKKAAMVHKEEVVNVLAIKDHFRRKVNLLFSITSGRAETENDQVFYVD